MIYGLVISLDASAACLNGCWTAIHQTSTYETTSREASFNVMYELLIDLVFEYNSFDA